MSFIIEIAEEDQPQSEWIDADLFAQRNADDDELMEAVARLRDGAKRVVLGGGACPMVTMTRREHRSAVTR